MTLPQPLRIALAVAVVLLIVGPVTSAVLWLLRQRFARGVS